MLISEVVFVLLESAQVRSRPVAHPEEMTRVFECSREKQVGYETRIVALDVSDGHVCVAAEMELLQPPLRVGHIPLRHALDRRAVPVERRINVVAHVGRHGNNGEIGAQHGHVSVERRDRVATGLRQDDRGRAGRVLIGAKQPIQHLEPCVEILDHVGLESGVGGGRGDRGAVGRDRGRVRAVLLADERSGRTGGSSGLHATAQHGLHIEFLQFTAVGVDCDDDNLPLVLVEQAEDSARVRVRVEEVEALELLRR